jgi:transposase
MEKRLFIGIDFSKKTLYVSVMVRKSSEAVAYRQFSNSKAGCSELLSRVRGRGVGSKAEWLFCGEHTGLYSLLLSEFLIKKGLFMWLENPMQIKLSTGIKRDKSDRTDSRDIALYACRYEDRAKSCQLPDVALKPLGLLLSFRDRLLQNKHTLPVSPAEIRPVMQRDPTARYIYEQSKRDMERLNREIKTVEEKMRKWIESPESLKENCRRVSSIKGVALINTVAIPVATQNFTRFANSRQFACYAGMAPFGRQSGSSIKTAPHVSHLADRKIKALLTQAALSAIRHDENIRQYYQRKKADGKDDRLIVNNIRSKLIHRIFALVRNRQLYQSDYTNPLDKRKLVS